MYQSPQKKSSSWTVTSIQKKSKSFSKPGSSAVQASRDANSPQSQDMPSYSTSAADLLTGSIMRSVETEEQEQVETSTVQRQSDSGRAAVAAVAPPIVSIPVVQPNSVGIQRQCSECAEKQQQPSEEEGKDVLEKSGAASGIQTKLTIGAIGDAYEQEADRVAAQVMSMPVAAAATPQLQRFGVEDSPVGMYSSLARSITPLVHRRVDEQVQMRSLVQRAFQAGRNEASGDLESRLNASKGGGSPLAPEVRAFMEPRFGADFSSVRVHTGGEAVQMNRELGAQAFAHGSDVYFGAGKSPGNNELTAHELTHVVQQTGTVQPQLKPNQPQNQSPQPQTAQSVIDDLTKNPNPNYKADFLFLNGRSMSDMLDILIKVDSLGGLSSLIIHDSQAVGVYKERIQVAMYAIRDKGKISPDDFEKTHIAILSKIEPEGKDAILNVLGRKTIGTEKVEVASKLEEQEAQRIIQDIKDKYEIDVSSQTGVDAIKSQYTQAPDAVKNNLKTKAWKLKELKALEKALAHFALILGANRKTSSRAGADQEITSASKVDQAIDRNSASGKLDTTTLGEFFKNSKNFSMFTAGENFDKDFPGNNDKQLEGTIVHEIAHGLMKYELNNYVRQLKYWKDADTPSGKANAEAPITDYGATNASEDLSEAVMYYFVEAEKLKNGKGQPKGTPGNPCPVRFALIDKMVKNWKTKKRKRNP
jgi:hypothetical protein